MPAIFLHYPNASAPTATLTLSPAFVTIQPYRRSAFQRIHISEDGTIHTYSVAAVVEEILEMIINDLQEENTSNGDGAASLLSFIANTLQYQLFTFELTDADGILNEVRLWSPEIELREAEGQARVQGRFSGRFLFRKEI